MIFLNNAPNIKIKVDDHLFMGTRCDRNNLNSQ